MSRSRQFSRLPSISRVRMSNPSGFSSTKAAEGAPAWPWLWMSLSIRIQNLRLADSSLSSIRTFWKKQNPLMWIFSSTASSWSAGSTSAAAAPAAAPKDPAAPDPPCFHISKGGLSQAAFAVFPLNCFPIPPPPVTDPLTGIHPPASFSCSTGTALL